MCDVTAIIPGTFGTTEQLPILGGSNRLKQANWWPFKVVGNCSEWLQLGGISLKKNGQWVLGVAVGMLPGVNSPHGNPPPPDHQWP